MLHKQERFLKGVDLIGINLTQLCRRKQHAPKCVTVRFAGTVLEICRTGQLHHPQQKSEHSYLDNGIFKIAKYATYCY